MIFISDKSSQSLNINNFLQQTTMYQSLCQYHTLFNPLNETAIKMLFWHQSLRLVFSKGNSLSSVINSGILVTRSMEHHLYHIHYIWIIVIM